MEEKIISRVSEITNKINDLMQQREDAIKNLKRMDGDIEVLSLLVFELKNLLEKDDISTDLKKAD